MKDNEILAILFVITAIAVILGHFQTKKLTKAYEQREFLNIIKETYHL
jgi:cell division protein FtsL